ncbi:hypothetical protein [Bradyrhizobium sp. 33ap4]|uniref:hypothetical protein n=1 Tax=Bradyrhizobium sp. 33ap4 TaxID=3061630 RepID=UPI0029315E23|nr:hypothetical protein [Bradyrhizobium sp. 33ap4]
MDEETMGVRDEIGFLTIHQRYADRFFPGTSVLYSLAWFARHTERRGALAAGYD